MPFLPPNQQRQSTKAKALKANVPNHTSTNAVWVNESYGPKEPWALSLTGQLSLNSGVAKSSTSFGWGKGGNVTSAGWQVTL